MLHGLGAGPGKLDDLVAVASDPACGADLLTPAYDARVLGNLTPREIAAHLVALLDDIQGERDYERITLIGHSIGALLVRKAYLDRLERGGFTHRHITPKSIVLTDAGVTKIAGLARAKRQEQGAGETWFDSEDEDVHYRSPESLRGKGRLDIRADIYGLGCVLYQLLAGRPPFLGPGAVVLTAHLESRPESIPKRKPSVPASLENIVMNCLEKSRADRYQHAVETIGPGCVFAFEEDLQSVRPRFDPRDLRTEKDALVALRDARLQRLDEIAITARDQPLGQFDDRGGRLVHNRRPDNTDRH